MKIVIFKLLFLFLRGQAFRISFENDCIILVVDTKAPKCELYVEEASENLNVSCPENQIIRIVGDFKVLHVNCSAAYPIDLQFDGIIPTEAIKVHSWRTVNDSTPGLEIELFHFDFQVLSISALYDYFKALNNQVELRDDFKYSRTGEYQLKGFGENATHTTSFYIFLEEPLAKLDFIRNNRTMWKNDSSGIYLPCRPTHYLANVTVNTSTFEEVESYDVTKGFTITTNASGSYSCEASFNGNVTHLTFDTTQETPETPFGFLKPLHHKGLSISFLYDYEAQFQQKSIRTNVYSSCEASDKSQPPFLLNMIGVRSYVELELASDFVLPAFASRSFGLNVGKETADLNQQLRTDGTHLRAGVAFCTNGVGYEAKLYGAGFTGNPYPFAFHHNMFNIDRDSSNINLFMKIDQKNPTQMTYDGDEVDFTCQVLTHILVPPVVWFVSFTDGSRQKVHVDYNLDDETSSLNLQATENMSQILCAVSMWHKEFWRNISRSIKVSKTEKPSIVNGSNPEYKKVSKDSALALICHARGTPLPSISWELQENDKTLTKLESSSSSTKNGRVTSTLTVANPIEGTYVCVASTGIYGDKKLYHVQFASIVGIEVWAIVLIFLAVALAASSPVFIYFRFFRKHQPLGLNRYEIAEFVTGEVSESQRAKGNEYAHEFAHLCPYDKSYEIDATRFQIDKTSFLGKGAFGVVLKGLVDGTPVAVKMISKNAEKVHLKALLTELKIQIHLGDHSHVVKFIGANTKDLSKGTVYMFVELCGLGNLESYLRANKDAFRSGERKPSWTHHTITLQDLTNWTLQIASGMEFLSSKKVIHGDLAARNILLDENRVAKITDFGLSRQFQAYADYVKKQLEPLPWRWMALESLQRLTFSSKSDVWAYGVTLWEIFTLGEVPYVGMSWNLNFVNELLEEGLRLPKPRHASEELYRNIMLDSWDNRPELRPSFSEIIQRIMQMFGMENDSSVEPSSYPPKAHVLSVAVDLSNYQQGV